MCMFVYFYYKCIFYVYLHALTDSNMTSVHTHHTYYILYSHIHYTYIGATRPNVHAYHIHLYIDMGSIRIHLLGS